jgi:hypothetical protein
MGLSQQFRGESGRQFTGIPYSDAIGKDNDLDKSVVAAIPVRNRIDDGLSDDRAGNLELNRGLRAGCARTHAAVDLAQDELHRLIDHFEHPPFVRLLGCDGFAFFRSMKMKAMDLRIVEEPARILTEQKHGGVRGPAIS